MKKLNAWPVVFQKAYRNYKAARYRPKIWRLPNPDIGYIKITKVASSSIELALAKHMHCDLQGGDESGINKTIIAQYGKKYAKHMTLKQFSKNKPAFTFAFVRNPFERLHSCYVNKIIDPVAGVGERSIFWNHGIELNISFEEFVTKVCKIPDRKINRHLRSQAYCLWDGEKIEADFVGKMENIEQDWQQISDRYGLPELAHKNKSTKRSNENVYSKKTVELVAARYNRDIALFGYEQEAAELIASLA